MGRYDKQLGPLTNLTDGGEGWNGRSFSIEEREKLSIRMSNWNKSDEGRKINSESHKGNAPSQETIQKGLETRRKNNKWYPTEEIKKHISEGLKNHIVSDETREKQREKALGRKYSKEKCEKHSELMSGPGNSKYKKLNYKLLIELYFSIISTTEMNKFYADKIGNSYGINKFYKILNFPINHLYKKTKLKKEYLFFVEQNKHKIQWYIDNYEKLEKEYFYKKHKERRNFTNNKEIKEVA